MRKLLFILFILLCSCVDEAYIDYSKISDKILEVPDPGLENDNTLAGIDSDGDGIRDDVQRWINAKYYKNPNLQNALKQYARDKQNELLNANDKEKSIKASHKMLDTCNCIDAILGDVLTARKISDKVRSLLLNTKARVNADFMTDKNFHGQSINVG